MTKELGSLAGAHSAQNTPKLPNGSGIEKVQTFIGSTTQPENIIQSLPRTIFLIQPVKPQVEIKPRTNPEVRHELDSFADLLDLPKDSMWDEVKKDLIIFF